MILINQLSRKKGDKNVPNNQRKVNRPGTRRGAKLIKVVSNLWSRTRKRMKAKRMI